MPGEIDDAMARRIRAAARRLRRKMPHGIDPLEAIVAALPVHVADADFGDLLSDPALGRAAEFGAIAVVEGTAYIVLPAGLAREQRREALARQVADAVLYGSIDRRPALPRPPNVEDWLAQTKTFSALLLSDA